MDLCHFEYQYSSSNGSICNSTDDSLKYTNNSLFSRNNKNTELLRINTKLTAQLSSNEAKGNEISNKNNNVQKIF